MDRNTTNIVKDIFIFLTEDLQIYKKITPGREKVPTLQKPVENQLNFEKKKFRILIPDKFRSHQTS